MQERAQTLTQAGAAICSSEPCCPTQPGTASARDLPENAQGTHRTPLSQPSPFSTAATLTVRDPHNQRNAQTLALSTSHPPHRVLCLRQNWQDTRTDTATPVWFSPALSPSHTPTLCILLSHYTADPCLHSLCSLGSFTSPFTLLSSSFDHSHLEPIHTAPRSPVQSPIHADTYKRAEIPNCTCTPWALPN